MFLPNISFTCLVLTASVISLPLYMYRNGKTFEISSDDKDYDEQNEIEMIQPADLKFYAEDDGRYKPLHSYVDNYNKRETVDKMQHINELVRLKPHIWENSNAEEENDKPFLAGFKEDLDKMRNQTAYKEAHRVKHNEGEEESTYSKNIPKRYTITGENDFIENTEPGEQVYDYEKFEKEYQEQIVEDIKKNKTFNDTKERVDELSKETLNRLFDFKNCTNTSRKLGIEETIGCFIRNYEIEKNRPAVKHTVPKIWLMIKVWLLIYICLAIPCWCTKGWCCCCFRCKLCFPRKRIDFAKKYYALNPPGTLNKPEEKRFVTYEPNEFEQDAYETFQATIRNI